MNCPRTQGQRVVCLALTPSPLTVTELMECGLLVSYSLNQARDTGTILNITNVVMYECVLEMCC